MSSPIDMSHYSVCLFLYFRWSVLLGLETSNSAVTKECEAISILLVVPVQTSKISSTLRNFLSCFCSTRAEPDSKEQEPSPRHHDQAKGGERVSTHLPTESHTEVGIMIFLYRLSAIVKRHSINWWCWAILNEELAVNLIDFVSQRNHKSNRLSSDAWTLRCL